VSSGCFRLWSSIFADKREFFVQVDQERDCKEISNIFSQGNIVTNSRETPSLREIVSLTVLVKLASFTGTSSSRVSGGNQMNRLLNRLQEHTKKKSKNDLSLSSEYERYANSDFVTLFDNSAFATFDLLGFWKAKESIFPVLSRMAIDIISVQATLVASESTFSTSGRVLSIQRTRLTPASLEMRLWLKDHLDAKERKQHKSGLENPIDFEEEILDAEVQQNKAIPLSEEEIVLEVASSEGMMSGPSSKGE
nr:zinc finger BED domain-containing protein RICESLEEPER 2-like [Tanacetum cinerariifolium]